MELILPPFNITAVVVTNGEEPSNGEVGTAIAGDMGDVGMRLLWGIVENKPLLRDPLCDIRTGDVPLDMQEFDLLWCWDELWWFKYVRCAIKFNFVHGMYAESSFLSLRSIQVGLPAVDRGEGEVGTGEPDEAELGDDGADGDLLLFLFTDKSTGSIWIGGHSASFELILNCIGKYVWKEETFLVKDAGEVNALVPAFPLLFRSDDDAFPPAKYSAFNSIISWLLW
jgi:hypothetical protein